MNLKSLWAKCLAKLIYWLGEDKKWENAEATIALRISKLPAVKSSYPMPPCKPPREETIGKLLDKAIQDGDIVVYITGRVITIKKTEQGIKKAVEAWLKGNKH